MHLRENRPILAAGAGMLTVGVILSVRGAILPTMLADLGLSYTVAGTLGLISPAFYVLTTLSLNIFN